jgi:hypothetical protein
MLEKLNLQEFQVTLLKLIRVFMSQPQSGYHYLNLMMNIHQFGLKNVKRYTDVYDDVDAFLPIVIDVDSKGTFAGFTNEATFAANFTQEIGILTNDTLLDYQNFQSAGMVANREKLIECGSIKESFKLTFVYELLLRMTYHSFKIMTIPRIGYKHTNLREGSIFWNYKNGSNKMTDTEVKFWIDSAKKEHFFSEDRGIKYEENVV